MDQQKLVWEYRPLVFTGFHLVMERSTQCLDPIKQSYTPPVH